MKLWAHSKEKTFAGIGLSTNEILFEFDKYMPKHINS